MTAKFSNREYEMVAEVLKKNRAEDIDTIIYAFIESFVVDNPRFDRVKFMQAAGLIT